MREYKPTSLAGLDSSKQKRFARLFNQVYVNEINALVEHLIHMPE